MRFILFVLPLLLIASCAHLKADAKIAGKVFVDCAKTDVTQVIADEGVALITRVAKILSGTKESWKADLDTIKSKAGPDAVACATKAALAVYAAETSKGFEVPQPVARGNEYIASLGVVFQ